MGIKKIMLIINPCAGRKSGKKNADKKNANTIEEENKMKALNRSLEEREINKIIQNLDKSRSSRHKQVFPNFNKNKSEDKTQNNDNKSKVSVQQKEQNKGKNKNSAKSKSPSNNTNKNKTQKDDKKASEKSPSPQKKATTKKKK